MSKKCLLTYVRSQFSSVSTILIAFLQLRLMSVVSSNLWHPIEDWIFVTKSKNKSNWDKNVRCNILIPEDERSEIEYSDVFKLGSEFNLIYFLESGVYIQREKRVECSKVVKSINGVNALKIVLVLVWLRHKWSIQDCNVTRTLSE